MTDILFIENDTAVRFQKKMWHITELTLARCYDFSINNDTGIIVAVLSATNKQCIYEFIRISFKNFSESPVETDRRDRFYSKLEDIYGSMNKNMLEVVKQKLPYYDQLYAHQLEGITFGMTRRVIFLAYEMRLGKSITAASVSRIFNIRRTVIICPAIAKWGWYRDLTSFWGFNELYFTMLDTAKSKSFIALQERFVIVNFDIIKKFEAHLCSDDIGHFIIDECFVYDTLIQTNIGMLKIGDIVENKINCYALSFDFQNNEYIYMPITNWLKKPLNKRLIKIKANGREFICTEDHKIWTKDGYKKAIHLSEGTLVLGMQEWFYRKEKGESYSSILFSQMCGESQQEKPRICKENIRVSPEAKSKDEVPSVQKGVFCSATSFVKKKVLLNFMFGNIHNEQPFNEVKKEKSRREIVVGKIKAILCKQSESGKNIIRENENEQSNEKSRNSTKNESKTSRENIFISWWKWSVDRTSKVIKFTYWMGDGICDKYRKSERNVQLCPESLQSRLSDSEQKNCRGSRWEESYDKKMEIFRQEKNGNFEYFRVESCEILERGSNVESNRMYKEGFVYDLTVHGNHNYFANGILVSNCHRIKNMHSDRSKIIQDIVDRYPNAKITFLSGTPIANRFNDLFNYFKLGKHPLGESYKKFTDEYTIKTASRGGERVTGAKNIQDLKTKMMNFMLVKRMDECFDMPEDVISKYTFDFDDYRDEYDKIIEEMVEAKESSALSLRGNLHSLNIITCKSKMKGIIEAIEEILTETKKIVVFGSYKEPLAMLEEYFGERCVKVDGSTNSFDRDKHKRKFWDDDKVEVFLGNYQAAGEALDLSCSNDVFTVNFPFTPRELNQALFRCKHPEKKGHIRRHYAFAKGSIDEYIYDIIASKEKDINQLVAEGKEVIDKENIEEILINKLLNREPKKDIAEEAVVVEPSYPSVKQSEKYTKEEMDDLADAIARNEANGNFNFNTPPPSFD